MAATLGPFLPAIPTSSPTILITTTSPASLLTKHLTVVSSNTAEDFPVLNNFLGGMDDTGEYDPPSPDSWIGESGSYPP